MLYIEVIYIYSLVQVLLDEIVCSTVHRCLDPVMMEPSVSHLIVLYHFSTPKNQSINSCSITSLLMLFKQF
jgi:hypothetical protein